MVLLKQGKSSLSDLLTYWQSFLRVRQVHAPEVQSAFLADRHISSSIAVSRVIRAMRQFRKISYSSDGVAMATKIQTKHKLTAQCHRL